jgi:hypothetical protein
MLHSAGYLNVGNDHEFDIVFHGKLVQYGTDDLFFESTDFVYNPPTTVTLLWVPEGGSAKGFSSTGVVNHTRDLLTNTPLGKEPDPEPEEDKKEFEHKYEQPKVTRKAEK